MPYAVNPVTLSQIKKSNYPFLEIKSSRQMNANEKNDSRNSIVHYKYIIFFLDEAEMMIEYTQINEIFRIQREI